MYGYPVNAKNVTNRRFSAELDDEYCIVRESNCDYVMVAGWHRKFSEKMVSQYECFNIHPSLLPKYRGVFPMEFQLRNKEKMSGVTIHKMNDRFDAGPIYVQQSFSIANVHSMAELIILASRAARKAVQYFIEHYPDINPCVQDEKQASYYSMADKYLLEENGLSYK